MKTRNAFSPQEIISIKNYKCNKKENSILFKLFLEHYWNFLSRFIPSSISPFLLSLIGFILEVTTFFISFFASRAISEPLPYKICIINGISTHIYQTLFNIGSNNFQCTNKISLLQCVAKHDISAIAGIIQILKLIMSYNFGSHIDSYMLALLSSCCFFLRSWEEYNTNIITMDFINGPDEGLLVISLAQIYVGFNPKKREIAYKSIIRTPFIVIYSLMITRFILKVFYFNIYDIKKAIKSVISLLPALITLSLSLTSVLQYQDPVWTPYFTMATCFALRFQSQIIFIGNIASQSSKSLLFNFSNWIIWTLEFIPVIFTYFNDGEFYWAISTIIIIGMMICFDFTVAFELKKVLENKAFQTDQQLPDIHQDQTTNSVYLFQTVDE